MDAEGAAAWLFGGRDGDRAFDDLWRLDLATTTWQRVRAEGDAPAKPFGHAASWMPGLGLVVFGGQAGSQFFDDLWAFDPVSARWARLPGDGRRPEPRYGTCAAAGPDGQLWISHGFTSSGRFDDTRAYDVATGAWRGAGTAGERPVERCLHDCLWTADGRLLLYGGQTTGAASLGDAWALDPTTKAWSRLPDPAPGARRLYVLATDRSAGAWLFGGADERSRLLDDAWHLDLVTLAWTRLPTTGEPGPAPRSGATLVVDAPRGRLLLFGGEPQDGASAELWQLAVAR